MTRIEIKKTSLAFIENVKREAEDKQRRFEEYFAQVKSHIYKLIK